MIKIIPYKNAHQNEIDVMMNEIAMEFDEQIFSTRTNETFVFPHKYWVAIHNSELIGTIGVLVLENNIGVLKNMMLKKEFRGKEFGVSKTLLETSSKWCKKNRISKLYLGTMRQFKAAQSFYKKNGFIEIPKSELPTDFFNNPLDTVFFRLDLN